MTLANRVIIIGFSLLVFAQITPAQTRTALPSKQEAKVLLDKAFDQTNLRSLGAPPFHLRVRGKSYGLKGQSIEGTYELWWASADRWREEVSWGGPPVVTIANTNHLSTLGEDTHLRDTLRVVNLLKFWPSFYLGNVKGILQIKSQELNGSSLVCVHDYLLPVPGATLHIGADVFIHNLVPQQTVCFDPVTGSPMEIEGGDSRWIYGGYSDLGAKRFPHQIHELEDKKPLIDVELEALEFFDISQFETFIPPSGAVSRAWCSDLIAPIPVYFGGPPRDLRAQERERRDIAPSFPVGYEDLGMIVFSVDENGRTVAVRALLPGGQHEIKDSEKHILMQSEFKPATCGGTPVKGEYIVWQ